MRKISLILTLCIFAALSQPKPAIGGVALGVEYANLERDIDISGFEFTDDASGVFSAFLGFELERSMFYIKIQEESSTTSSDFFRFDIGYDKSEYSAEWAWNDSTSKTSAGNVSVGILYTQYDIGANINLDGETEMFGLSVGAGGTKYFGKYLFLVGSAKLKFHWAQEEDLFIVSSSDEETSGFFGYEAKAGLGVSLGQSSPFSVQFGLKWHSIDFEDRFYEDESFSTYIALRLFISSGD